MNHPHMATRHEELARQPRQASSSRGTNYSRPPHPPPLVFFMAAQPPPPAKSVKFKEGNELATTVVIPNNEQMRELERAPESPPRSHHGRRSSHRRDEYEYVEDREARRYREERGGTRAYVNATAEEYMRDQRGDSRRRRR